MKPRPRNGMFRRGLGGRSRCRGQFLPFLLLFMGPKKMRRSWGGASCLSLLLLLGCLAVANANRPPSVNPSGPVTNEYATNASNEDESFSSDAEVKASASALLESSAEPQVADAKQNATQPSEEEPIHPAIARMREQRKHGARPAGRRHLLQVSGGSKGTYLSMPPQTPEQQKKKTDEEVKMPSEREKPTKKVASKSASSGEMSTAEAAEVTKKHTDEKLAKTDIKEKESKSDNSDKKKEDKEHNSERKQESKTEDDDKKQTTVAAHTHHHHAAHHAADSGKKKSKKDDADKKKTAESSHSHEHHAAHHSHHHVGHKLTPLHQKHLEASSETADVQETHGHPHHRHRGNKFHQHVLHILVLLMLFTLGMAGMFMLMKLWREEILKPAAKPDASGASTAASRKSATAVNTVPPVPQRADGLVTTRLPTLAEHASLQDSG